MDKMIDAANEAGALGSKIVGSGGGGCIVAIVQDQNKNKIIEAIKGSGAEDDFSSKHNKRSYLEINYHDQKYSYSCRRSFHQNEKIVK